MKCPACSNQLTETETKGIILDVCQDGCGGVWFDKLELEKMQDMPEEVAAHVLRVEKNFHVVVDHRSDRFCPCCSSQVLHRYTFDSGQLTELDECLQCGGIWLDLGEFDVARRDTSDRKLRDQSVTKYLEKVKMAHNGETPRGMQAVLKLIF